MNLKHMFKVYYFLNEQNQLKTIIILETAPESYWHIMAEHYRTKLEEVTRENQQVRNMEYIS